LQRRRRHLRPPHSHRKTQEVLEEREQRKKERGESIGKKREKEK